jgi:hypothetical protein
VTADTGQLFPTSLYSFDGMDNRLMTMTTGVFAHRPTPCFYLDGFVKVSGGKGVGMPKAVIGFGVILGKEVYRGVTVVAGRH